MPENKKEADYWEARKLRNIARCPKIVLCSGSKLRSPKYNDKGGRDFVVFSLHFRAWLNTQGCGAVLNVNFDYQVPAKRKSHQTQ